MSEPCPQCGEHHERYIRVFAVHAPYAEFLDEPTNDPYQIEAIAVVREKLVQLKAGEELHCSYHDKIFRRRNAPTAIIIAMTVYDGRLGIATSLLCKDCADAMTADGIADLAVKMKDTLMSSFAAQPPSSGSIEPRGQKSGVTWPRSATSRRCLKHGGRRPFSWIRLDAGH